MKKKRSPNRSGYHFLMAHVGHRGDECVVWPYSCCTAGYGSFMIEGKVRLAHREMCRHTHGNPPSVGHQAAHSCGNRRCINPNHLSWKMPRDNQLDRKAHGTHAIRRSKITAVQAEQIKRLKGLETSIKTAARYGITESNVRLIQDGHIWRTTGRVKRGSMSPEQVRAIRKIGRSKTQGQIAAEIGCSETAVWSILNGHSYKWVA